MDELTPNTPTPAVAPEGNVTTPPVTPTAPAPVIPQLSAPPVASPDGAAPAAPTPEATDAPATFGEAVAYEPTGDASLDMALAFIGKHGLGPDHPAIVAAGNGDFGPVTALLAEKDVQGYAAYVALAEQGYQRMAAEQAAKAQAVQAIVTQAAGDADTWAVVQQWASANAEPHEREAVNAALEQGGIQAEAMAHFLVHQYRSATGTTYTPTASAVKPDAVRGAANPSGDALSPKDYGQAVSELRRAKGADFERTREYQELQARRARWRG